MPWAGSKLSDELSDVCPVDQVASLTKAHLWLKKSMVAIKTKYVQKLKNPLKIPRHL